MEALFIGGLLLFGFWAAFHNVGTHQALDEGNAAQATKESNAACLPIVLAIVCLGGLFLLAGAGAGIGMGF